MSFNNRNNLPNTSAPWGREVEQRIESAERNISQNSREASNSLSTIGNTLGGLQNAINSLDALVVRLAESKSFHTFPASVTGGLPVFFQYTGTISAPAWASMATVVASVTRMSGTMSANATGGLVVGNAAFGSGESTWGEKIFSYSLSGTDPYSTYAMSAIVDVSTTKSIWYGGTLGGSGSGNLSFDVIFSIDWA